MYVWVKATLLFFCSHTVGAEDQAVITTWILSHYNVHMANSWPLTHPVDTEQYSCAIIF